MKKNLIIRKRHLLTIPMLLMIISLSGCGPQLTVETYTHEAGEELPEDAAAYAEFKNPENAKEAIVDVSGVDPDKVGTYEAAITLKNKEYPFSVEVVDTTAPTGELNNYFIITAESLEASDFVSSIEDYSEHEEGLRNLELILHEGLVRSKFEDEIGDQNLQDVLLDMDKIFELNWAVETHGWEENGLSNDDLKDSISPEKDGLYSLEVVSVDVHGNATISKVYALVDTSAPKFSKSNNINVTVEPGTDFEEYMESTGEGLLVIDNFLGDITDAVQVINTELVSQEENSLRMTVSYLVTDLAGNESSSERNITITSVEEIKAPQESASSNANGFDRSRAEQAFAQVNQQRAAAGLRELVWDESMYEFACTRTTHIVTDFSHNLPDGTGVSEYLLYNVGGASGYGENIARNYKSINNLVNAWMNSQGHKENILDSRYTAGVMACYYHNGSYYWVNLFKAQ